MLRPLFALRLSAPLGLLLPLAASLPIALASPIAAFAQATPTTAAPALSPFPQELHAQALIPVHAAQVDVPGGDPEDLFAAQNLNHALAQDGLVLSPAAGSVDLTIHLLRADSRQARQLLSAAKLSFTAPMHDEGYILLAQPSASHKVTVSIIAQTSAGVFYGAQTLKQLVESTPTGEAIWTAIIRDWPAMKYRGEDDDLSRGPFPTLAFMEHQLEVFAAHKINLYSPYFESNLEYSADPSPRLPAAPSPAPRPASS